MKISGLAFVTTFLLCFLVGCNDSDPMPEDEYFPKSDGSWEVLDPASLGWNTREIEDLYTFLDDGNTRAFILLKDGKIVLEHYNGKNLLGSDFTQSSNWYWASAAKTLTATLTGIAIEEGFVEINASSSDYLGKVWSSLTEGQEDAVTVWNHLTMTTGLDDGVDNNDCTDQECLIYLRDPGTRWAYHNAPYTILDGIIEGGTDVDFDTYFNQKLRNPIGMDGFWSYLDYNHLYFSTARSMARFGLLIQHQGMWQAEQIVPADYHLQMTSPSQDINKSYGYLWWLNGQPSYMLPGLQIVFNGSITPNAPASMYAAMGKNGQLLNIVPDENLIVVRMGDNPDNSLVPAVFQNELWEKLNKIID